MLNRRLVYHLEERNVSSTEEQGQILSISQELRCRYAIKDSEDQLAAENARKLFQWLLQLFTKNNGNDCISFWVDVM
ncbi:hypothetical protein WG66_009026 [Moniliophthora roreri]|nr:hypothetical protein WG66_009026 [Moniliophthora roreri]